MFISRRYYHFSKLNLRIGLIQDVKNHPQSSKLYISQVQLQNNPAITKHICSGLQEYLPISALLNQQVVVLENIKKCKLRGEISEAMLLCGVDSQDANNVQLCKPSVSKLDCIGSKVVLLDTKGQPANFTQDNVNNNDTISKFATKISNVKPKVWEEISKRFSVGEKGIINFLEDTENETSSSPFTLAVWNEIEQVYIPIIAENLTTGSKVC